MIWPAKFQADVNPQISWLRYQCICLHYMHDVKGCLFVINIDVSIVSRSVLGLFQEICNAVCNL